MQTELELDPTPEEWAELTGRYVTPHVPNENPALEALASMGVDPWDLHGDTPLGSARILPTDSAPRVFTVDAIQRPANPMRAGRARFNIQHPEHRTKPNTELRAELEYLADELAQSDTAAAQHEAAVAMCDVRAELEARRPLRTLQRHSVALAQAAQDPAQTASLSYAERLLLALCVQRDTDALPPQLGAPFLRLAVLVAAFARLTLLRADDAALAATLHAYAPPTPADFPESPQESVKSLTLAPGAPSRAVCV